MSRAYNFSAGPATLPEPVLRQAQADMLEFGSAGASLVELSHRGPEFIAVAQQTEADLRTLLSIPDDYAVLFTAGGATTTQALLPLNFAAAGQPVDYVVTGHWGKTALKQAKPYAAVNVAASSEADGFRSIPARASWNLSPDAAYVHITANETIHGVEFRDLPDTGSVPLFADFSSSIASEPLDVRKFGAIYAGAQKNLGPVGIGVLIVDRELLERAGQPRADIFDFRAQLKGGVHAQHPAELELVHARADREVDAGPGRRRRIRQAQCTQGRALYAVIDSSGGFYRNEVDAAVRSRMNVPFFLIDEALDKPFLRRKPPRPA